MMYRRDNKMDRVSVATLVAIALIVWLAYAVMIECARPVGAQSAPQWMKIDQFKGLATHTNGINRDMSVARQVDGWLVQNEGLVKPWFSKIRGNPVITSPTYILGQNSSSDRVLLFSDNFFSLSGTTIDPIGYAQTARADSAYSLSTTDSIIYSWEDGNGTLVDTTFRGQDNWWLLWTLTTRSSMVWDSLNFSTRFYSNRWVLNTGTAAQAVQTRPTGFPVATPSVDEGSGTLDLPIDSTLIFDGTYIWVYSGDTDSILNSSTTTVTNPTYADTGRVINTYESGDSLILVIDPQSNTLYDTNFTAYYILWDDSLLTSHAIPCSVLSAIEYSTDSARLIVLADTTKYKGVNHYWGRQNGVGAQHMQYVLYRPGALVQYRRLGDVGANKSRDSLVTTGGQSVGPAKYARWHTHVDQTGANGIWNLLTAGFNSRTTDCNVWQVTTDVGTAGDEDTAYAILLNYAVSDVGSSWRYLDFLLFDTDSLKASEWTSNSAINSIYQRPKKADWAITTVSTTTSNDRFATIHRQRAFASGNTHINSTTDKRDSTLWVRYTKIVGVNPSGDTTAGKNYGNYSQFPTANKFLLEGADPVTGLSSLGQTLALYRRRGISLLSGFSAADFYVQPAPVGQGAANHWCISRDPLTNQDVLTNENGIFYFGGGGLEPLSEDIVELFSDSINWYAENKIRASVYDNKYFLTAPVGSSDTVNDKIIGLDLETRQAWTFTGFNAASAWNFRDDDGSEQMFFGDRDSTVVWEMDGATSNLNFTPEWKSSWSDLGDADQVKRVLSHRIAVDPGHYTDTLYVDWFIDLQDTVNYNDTLQQVPQWTDTIPLNINEAEFFSRYASPGIDYPGGQTAWTKARNLARGKDTRRQTIQRQVPRRVAGKYLSFGLRGRSVATSPLLVTGFEFEYLPIGERRR